MIVPPIKRLPAPAVKFNARNYMWGILIHRGIDAFKGVLAQEVYEWRYKWTVGLAMALPIVLATYLLSDHAEALILGGLLAVIALLVNVRIIPALHRRMELVGHMIEVIVAAQFYGKDEPSYAQSEANIMAVHYKQFKGETPTEVLADMLEFRPKAIKWVNRYRSWLTRIEE